MEYILDDFKPRKRKKWIYILLGAVILTQLFLYVPQFFINDKNNTYTNVLNKEIISDYNNLLESNKSEDFDNDGLSNEDEFKNNTNIFNPDCDNDGLSDGYDEKPNSYNNILCENMESFLKEKNQTYENPFMNNSHLLWSKNIESRTYGNMISTLRGYYFDNFTGYVQFNKSEGIPYKIVNNIHIPLDYDKTNDVYYVENGDMIELLNDNTEYMYRLDLFGNAQYIKDNFFSKLINLILPQKGFISSIKMLLSDADPDIKVGNYIQNIKDIDYDLTNLSRLKKNDNLLSNLKDVRNNIDKGYALAVSLIDDTGETLGIVYGYDYYGNLLVANYTTKEDLGVIYISERYKKIYTSKDDYYDYYYYEFTGLGYDSINNARISFFASTI